MSYTKIMNREQFTTAALVSAQDLNGKSVSVKLEGRIVDGVLRTTGRKRVYLHLDPAEVDYFGSTRWIELVSDRFNNYSRHNLISVMFR